MRRAQRSIRIAFAAFLAVNAIALTYPGFLPFNRIRPLIFGLPFSFFWVALWIVLGFVMLVITDIIETR